MAAIGVFGWLGIFSYFRLVGHTADFVDAVFSYNRFYAGHPIRALGFQFEFPQRVLGPLHRAAATPLLLLLSVLGIILRGNKHKRLWILWLAYVLAVDVSVQTTVQAHGGAHERLETPGGVARHRFAVGSDFTARTAR